VLDGYTLNPGDLSWALLETRGSVTVFERTSPDEILEHAADAQALITNKAILKRGTIEQLPSLRYIGVTATGYNIVDIQACKELGIVVTNVPAYSTASVAQLVFAHILEHCHHVEYHSRLVHEGIWAHSKDFAFWKKPLIELEGLTLGIVGYGNIGQQVAKIGIAFGMKVLVNSRTEIHEPGMTWLPFEQLLPEADFVSLHCPLTPETEGMINMKSIRLMKNGAYLINTGRGQLIVEQDLADALAEGHLSGAGLDVLSVEPPSENNPLLKAPNTCITPHIAWATRAARVRLMKTAVENLVAWQEDRPVNVVT